MTASNIVPFGKYKGQPVGRYRNLMMVSEA
jgi:hypothetical protein